MMFCWLKRPALVALVLTVLGSFTSFSQCSVTSSHGYVVNVSICPSSIVVSTTDCPWSYNYNVKFNYNVTISGPNATSLNTLQTEIVCRNSDVNGYYALPLNGGSGSAVTVTNPSISGNNYNYGNNPSCTQATVSSLKCTGLRVIIQGPGIPHQTVDCNCMALVLPVELISLDAKKVFGDNSINWSVQSESRNDFFTIEYSEDGKSWDFLANVDSKGDTDQLRNYTYSDSKHRAGYYKLSQTDLNGTRNELGIAYVPFQSSELTIYPNPSRGVAPSIEFSAPVSDALITVYGQDGKVLMQTPVTSFDKQDNFLFKTALDVNAAPGMYWVEVSAGNELVGRQKWMIE